MFNLFNIARLVRVHQLVKNANGTFMRITFTKEDGTKRNLVGRTGVKWRGQASPMFRSPYHITFYSLQDGFRTVRVDKVQQVASCGRVEIV